MSNAIHSRWLSGYSLTNPYVSRLKPDIFTKMEPTIRSPTPSGQHPHHTETGQLPYLGSRDNDSNKISIGDKRCQMVQRHSTRTFLPTPRKQNFRRHRQVGQYAVPQFCRLTEYTCQWMQFPHKKDCESEVIWKIATDKSTMFSSNKNGWNACKPLACRYNNQLGKLPNSGWSSLCLCGKLKNCGFSWWHRRTKPKKNKTEGSQKKCYT